MDSSSLESSGVFVDVFGISHGGRGRNCDIHSNIPCGSQLQVGSVLVARETVEHRNGVTTTFFPVNTHSLEDGTDGCRVGFLPLHMLERGDIGNSSLFNNKYYKVVKIYSSEELKSKRGLYKTQGCLLAEMLIEKQPRNESKLPGKRAGGPGSPDKEEREQQKKIKIDKLEDGWPSTK